MLPFQDAFATVHVLYGVITCAVPVVGVAVATFALRLRRAEKGFGLAIVLAVVLIVPAPVGYYATNVEPNQLAVNEHSVAIATATATPIRVGMMSDIQSASVGAFERRSVEALVAQRPDLILYAGDLYSGEDNPLVEHRDDFVDLVSEMRAPFGTFFVHGDHDNDERLASIVNDGGSRLLDNEVDVVNVRDTRVGILGLNNSEDRTAIQALQNFADRTDLDVKIVLAHRPDIALVAPVGIDLIVSGHTHGGQVQLPFVGPLLTLSEVPRSQAGGGLFIYPNGFQLFISRGVGVERGAAPKIRFGAKPEVNVLELSGKSDR